MCGRYFLLSQPADVKAQFGYADDPNFPPRENIPPTEPVAVVKEWRGAPQFTLMRWGFIPSWVKDLKTFPLLFNARAEGIEEKASFKNAIRRRRCLIPADGFYEWRRVGKQKQPFRIQQTSGELMAFAGIWECWATADGSEIDTCAIITCAANATVSAIHERMPVIIPQKKYARWLDPALPMGELQRMLKPADEDLLEIIDMDTGVFARKR